MSAKRSKRSPETQRRSETTTNDQRHTRFYVRDATGRVLIDPENAEIELADSGTRFDQAQSVAVTRTRTLGHRHQEQSLAVGTQVFILGCVVDGQGQPMIARGPKDRKQKFIISRRGERELASAAASAARYWSYAAAGSGALGVVLVVVSLLIG